MIATEERVKTLIEEIEKIELVKPENAGDYWEGIHHNEFMGEVDQMLQDHNFYPIHWKITLSNDKADMLLAATFPKNKDKMPKGFIPGIGFRNDNTWRKGIVMYSGVQHVETGNTIVTHQMKLRKHTKGLELDLCIRAAIEKYQKHIKRMRKMLRLLENYNLKEKQVDEIIGAAGRALTNARVGSWSFLGKVMQEYVKPTQFGMFNDPTSLGLMMAFSHQAKQLPPLRQLEALYLFRQLLPIEENKLPRKLSCNLA